FEGATGLVLLASGRYTETEVDVGQLLGQGRRLRGFWVGLAQLPRSHPFTVRRLERLVGLGLLVPAPAAHAATTSTCGVQAFPGARPRARRHEPDTEAVVAADAEQR